MEPPETNGDQTANDLREKRDLQAMLGPQDEKKGDKVGLYELKEKIGEGGMGIVWRAYQTAPLQREVAFKVIRAGFNSAQVLSRFLAERETQALMDHPNIAKVFDAGTTPAGRPFFVMELIPKMPVTKYCDDQKLSIRERLELFIPICRAIQHAHQKGIIHRDIKPSNVLVGHYDGRPVPKIIDFGVAKAVSQSLEHEPQLTTLGQMVGTPEYMSPEQAVLGQTDIDTRTDIYSLGVLLYELLTGASPFGSNLPTHEILRRIREEDPPTPSTKLNQGRSSNPTIFERRRITDKDSKRHFRDELDWIVMKALEKDRAKRYETASQFAEVIDIYLKDGLVPVRPQTWSYRLSKTIRRHRIAFFAGCLIFLALAGGFGVSTWFYFQERQANDLAISENGFLTNMLNGIQEQVTAGYDTKLIRKLVDDAATRVTTNFVTDPEVGIEIRRILARTYRDLGEYPQMKLMITNALAVAYQQKHPPQEEIANLYYDMGNALMHLNELEEARQFATNALAMQRSIFGNTNAAVASTLNLLGNVLAGQNNWTEAEATHREAWSIRQQVFGKDSIYASVSLLDMAIAERDLTNLDEADSNSLAAIEICQTQLPAGSPDFADLFRVRAEILWREGKFPEAEKFAKDTFDIDTLHLAGTNRRDLDETIGILCNVLCSERKLDEVKTYLKLAIEKRKHIASDAVGISTLYVRFLYQSLLNQIEKDPIQDTELHNLALQNYDEIIGYLNKTSPVLDPAVKAGGSVH